MDVFCPSCDVTYHIGQDAIVVTMEDVHSAFGAVMGSESAIRASLLEPDLVTFTSDENTAVQVKTQLAKSRENIRRVEKALAEGYSRNWRCGKCERVYEYPVVSSNSGDCLIATAAFGSPVASQVLELKDFRDQSLVKCRSGRALSAFYYKVSPNLADFIRSRPRSKVVICLIIKRVALPLIRAIRKGNPGDPSRSNVTRTYNT